MSLTLRARIALTLVPVVAFLAILGVVGVAMLSHLGSRIDGILREDYASVMAMERLREALERIDSSFQFALSGEPARARAQYLDNWKAYGEALRFEQGNITARGEGELLDELAALTEHYRRQGDAFFAGADRDARHPEEYFGPSGLLDTFTRIKAVSSQIIQINQESMEQASAAARRTARTALVGFAIGLALTLALAGLAGWRTYHTILGPVRALTRSARGVGAGQLNQVVPYLSRDALGELVDAFNDMARHLREDRQSAREQAEALAATAGTLRKELSERAALEQSVRHLAAIVESSADAIVSRRPDGTIASWNKGAEHLFGYTAGTIVGQSTLVLVPPEYQAEWSAILDRVYRGEHVEDVETVRRRRDGSRVWVTVSCFPVRDEGGAVVGAASIMRDITERKQARDEVRRLAQLQAVVADLGERALRSASSADLLNQAAAAVASSLDVDFCNVLELLPGGDEFLFRAGVGWGAGVVGWARVKSAGSQPGYVVRSERPVIVEDAAAEARFVPLPRSLGEEATSSLSVAIFTPEGPYGALGVHTRRRRKFTPDEVNFLQAVANVLGAAIQRQRAEDRLRRADRAHTALSSCNQALIRATDEAEWLARVCRIIVEQAGYRLCWVGYAGNDPDQTVRPVAQAGFEEGYLLTVNITWADRERGRGPTGTSIRTGRPVVFKNLATEPAFAPWRAEAVRRGYASAAGIPLAADGTTLGALTIYAAEPDAFGDEEVRLLKELADDLAFGVMNLRRRAERAASAAREAARQREVEIAARIQQMLLLGRPPADVPGLRAAALTIPSQNIDGDFYAFYQHAHQHLDVMVADVMGKGIPAALLGAATRGRLLEALYHLLAVSRNGRLPPPREVVTLAHAQIAPQLMELNSFVTLAYVRFDLDGHRLDLVDCGHTGLIHYQAATGRCDVLHGANLPLGVRAGEVFEQMSVPYATGDQFLLFSDGITEARGREGELFGEGRLVECVRQNGGLEPDQLVEAVRRAAFAYSASAVPQDDWTCVAVKVAGRAPPLGRAELALSSDLGELHRARAFLRAACHDLPPRPLDEDATAALELAVTEACSNVARHAYHGAAGRPVHLEVEAYPDQIRVLVCHLGDAFDPAGVPPPVFDGSQMSGFGVYLIGRCVDDVRYDRDDRGRNRITLVKRRKS